MMNWVATVAFHYGGTFPQLDTGQLYGLVTGMLGFGTMRAVEKIKGVQDSQPLAPATTGGANAPILSVPVPTSNKKKFLGVKWPF
jgi:hypothetical protein